MTTHVDIPSQPRGRDEVRAALIETAVQMFVESGNADISVRQVAARAGVNHGLVHRHFGSKRELLGAVLDHLAQEVADDGADAADAVGSMFRGLESSPYWRLLGRLLQDGEMPEHAQSTFPAMKLLIERYESGQRDGSIDPSLDPRLVAAGAAALGVGWMFFEPFLLASTGLDQEPTEVVRQKYAGFLAELQARLAPRDGSAARPSRS